MDENIKLSLYLEEDSDDIKKVKNLEGDEEDYFDFFDLLESSILELYLENDSLKDSDVIDSLSLIKENFDKDISFFENSFDQGLIILLCDELQNISISSHELTLILDYILSSIEEKNWMDDDRAYLKWLKYISESMEEDELVEYEENIRLLGKKYNLSEEEIDDFLELDLEEDDLIEENLKNIQNELSLMNEDEQYEFVFNNFMENPELFQVYISSLLEKKEFEKAIKLHEECLKVAVDFPPIELSLATIYDELGQKELVVYHCEKAEKGMENLPLEIKNTEEMISFKNVILELKKSNL